MKLFFNLFIFTLLSLIVPLLSSPDSSASSSDDATLPRKTRKKAGLFLTLPDESYERLCTCCKTSIPEKKFADHVHACAWDKLKKSIVTKPAPIKPEPVIIPPLDLSSPEQSAPTTPTIEIDRLKKMLKRAEPESVFAAIDAKNRYPFKEMAYVTIIQIRESLTDSETPKRHCSEPTAAEE